MADAALEPGNAAADAAFGNAADAAADAAAVGDGAAAEADAVAAMIRYARRGALG